MEKAQDLQDSKEFWIKYKKFLKSDKSVRGEIVKDNDFVKQCILYLDSDELNSFFWMNYRYFNRNLLDSISVMKPLTVKVFNAIQESKLKSDLEAMREIAAQPGIHPMILCYVDPIIRNDFQFIANILAYTNCVDDFYQHSMASFEGSQMRYGDSVGKDIQTNPLFWEMLNSLMKKKNPDARLFDVEAEMEIAKKHFAESKKINVSRSDFNTGDDRIIAELEKGEYFGIPETYRIKFNYGNPKQREYLYKVFFEQLIPSIGSNSRRSLQPLETIMPYLVDEFGVYTDNKNIAKLQGGIGGTNIPDDLLVEFVKRLVEFDKCKVVCGELEMVNKFSQETIEYMIETLNKKDKAKK